MTATSHEPPTDEQLIRRGRGEAFAALRRDPSLAEVVLDSALVDDCWDGIDQRDDYLAQLLLQSAADVSDLIADASGLLGSLCGDVADHGGFSADVTIRLAARGEQRSAAALRAAIEGGGAGSGSWVRLVEQVWDAHVPGLHEDLASLVLPRLRDGVGIASLLDHLAWLFGPWPVWAGRDDELAAVLQEAERRFEESPAPRWYDMSDAELLSELRSTPGRTRGRLLTEIGRRGQADVVLELATQLELRTATGTLPGLRSAMSGRATEHLPRVLETARGWATGPDPFLRDTAVATLADHGEERDVRFLIQGWNRAMENEDYCAPERLAPAFARLGVVEAVPHLLAEFHASPHSFARADVLAALADLAPADTEPLLEAALRDAQSHARALAATRATLTPSTLAVLAGLADDAHERDGVRAAAATRLGRSPTPHP